MISAVCSLMTLIKNQVYQIILVAQSKEIYHCIQKYCAQLSNMNNCGYQLHWQSNLAQKTTYIDRSKEQIYLIDSQQLPSLNYSEIAKLKSDLNSNSIIILVNNYQTGMVALKAGAIDYLDKSQLNLAILERSLRLTVSQSSPTLTKFQGILELSKLNLTLDKVAQQIRIKTQINFEEILGDITSFLIKDHPYFNRCYFESPQISAKTKAQLEASEALYKSIFNHSSDGLFLIDIQPNDQLIYETINPAYEQMIGKTQAEIIGQSVTDVLPTEVANLLIRQYRACIASQQSLNYEHTLDRNGETYTWRTNLVPILDLRGEIVKLQGNTRDITAEKRAIAHQIHYTRYRHLLRSVTLKIRQSLDLQDILKTTVIELQKTLSADRVFLLKFLGDSVGKVIEEAVKADFPSLKNQAIINPCFWQQLKNQCLEGSFYACQDTELIELASGYRDFIKQYSIRANLVLPIFRHKKTTSNSTNNSLQNSETIDLWGLLCVQQCSQPRQWTTDEIELLQQLVEQLNIALSQAELLNSEIKQRQELARSNAELEQFAYIASHDLQAPLQTISNYVQLLERRYQHQLDPKATKYIEYILDGVERMRTQINDLLEYSRVGRQKSTFREIDCNLILEQALANLRAEITKNQAIITSKSNLPTLVADSSQLIMLFQNLIGNSLKYRSLSQPVIEINVQHQEGSWQFTVSDNGIGIEPKYQQRIFKIFQRLHTQEEYSGTGIGLAICQKIIENHGGTIWVESQLDRGSTFYFTLPDQSK